jgi:hypothetical protein
MSTAPRSSLTMVSVILLIEIVIIAAALSVPLRLGASLGEAIAVLPQRVLWIVPLALTLPVLLAFAARLRPPHRSRQPDPATDPFPVGRVAALADAIRAARTVRFARYRVVEHLVELGTYVAAECRHTTDPQAAWRILKEDLAGNEPDAASFLRSEGLHLLTGEAVVAMVDRSLAALERCEQKD